jgi:WD40 repeat protein
VIYTGTEIIEVLAISPDASWLACGSEKNAIRLIPLKGNNLQFTLNGHSDKIKSLIFSFDGKYLYSASLDGKVLKWDLSSRSGTDITSGSGRITSIDISSSGNYLAGLNPEGNVILWNPESVSENFRLPTELKDIKAIRFKPNENTLAIGDVNGNVELWDISSLKKISAVKAHNAQVNDIEFNPVLKQMATAGMDNALKIYNNLEDLTEPPVTFTDSGNFVLIVRFSPDGQLILSGAYEGDKNLVSRPAHVDYLAQDICTLVSRNMTQEEWNVYVARDLPLEKTCGDKEYNIKVNVIR